MIGALKGMHVDPFLHVHIHSPHGCANKAQVITALPSKPGLAAAVIGVYTGLQIHCKTAVAQLRGSKDEVAAKTQPLTAHYQ